MSNGCTDFDYHYAVHIARGKTSVNTDATVEEYLSIVAQQLAGSALEYVVENAGKGFSEVWQQVCLNELAERTMLRGDV